ncbi:MAG: hypothetical protein KAH22_06780 [Thiotrichaceae bacterium]|nr:hypothetical protein [Thiotrichaceae bacterium]
MKKGMIELMIVLLGVVVAVPSTAQSPYSKSIFQAGKEVVVARAPKKVLGGPYVSSRLKGDQKTELKKSGTTIKLNAILPSKLSIKSSKIRWIVTRGSKKYRASGHHASFNLKPGKYTVSIKVDKLVKNSRTIKVIKSRNSAQNFSLSVKAGRLVTYVASKDEVVKVFNSKGQVIATSNSEGYLSRVLPVGRYTVKTKARGRNQIVKVLDGKTVSTRFKASRKGTVEVRALNKGSSILPKGARINIYSSKGKEIKSVLRSTYRIKLSPGSYKATLTIKGVEKTRKEFKIVHKKTQSIILKM